VGWYALGYYFGEPFLVKHGRFFSITPESFERAKVLFHKYHTKILIISKMTLGLGMALAVLMAAGAMKIPFKKYITLNAIGEVVLVGVLISIGYFFGNLYSIIDKGFKGLFLFGFTVLILAVGYGFAKYVKNKAKEL
jgi:membrane protein DedA with SNARE-associated domain